MILETKRLILRKPRRGDWKDIREICNEKDISKQLSKVPFPYTKTDAEWFVNNSINKWRRKKLEDYIFFIELKSEKKIIGVIGIHKINKYDKKATTGSYIHKQYWRNAFMTEAKIAVNEFVFNKLKLNKLETSVRRDNKASNATQKGVGYNHEGRRIQSAKSLATGKFTDIELYGLLKKDWKKNLPKLKRKLNLKIKKLENNKK